MKKIKMLLIVMGCLSFLSAEASIAAADQREAASMSPDAAASGRKSSTTDICIFGVVGNCSKSIPKGNVDGCTSSGQTCTCNNIKKKGQCVGPDSTRNGLYCCCWHC